MEDQDCDNKVSSDRLRNCRLPVPGLSLPRILPHFLYQLNVLVSTIFPSQRLKRWAVHQKAGELGNKALEHDVGGRRGGVGGFEKLLDQGGGSLEVRYPYSSEVPYRYALAGWGKKEVIECQASCAYQSKNGV